MRGNRWLPPTSFQPHLPLAQQAPPKAAREEGGSEGGEALQAGSEGAGEGGGEGDLGGGALAANSMPFVPTVDVMMLLLKGYAGVYCLRMGQLVSHKQLLLLPTACKATEGAAVQPLCLL